MNITLNKEAAIKILKENRQKHIDTFQETVDGWKVAMEEYSSKLNEWAMQNKDRNERPAEPVKPVDHTKDYDDLIRKLEFHALQLVEVSDYEFEQIINDQFGWTGGFLATSNLYSSN